MKFLIDLLPVVVMFVVFKLTKDMPNNMGMIYATAAAMVASVLQLALLKIKKMPIKPLHWFGFVTILVLGGITVYLGDGEYVKYKFTIVEWVLAAVLLIGQYGFKKNMLKAVIGTEMQLPDVAWNKLSVSYAVFFILMGALNLFIIRHYAGDDNLWMNFKLYGSMGLTLVFVLWQSTWLGKYLTDESSKAGKD